MKRTQKIDWKSSWKRHFLSLAITVFCLAFIIHKIDFAALQAALLNFHWPYLIYGVLVLACGYSLRIYRWLMMLKAAHVSVGYRDCVGPFLGAVVLNNVLPLRIGDILRALVFPTAMGIGKMLVTSSLILERILDIMTLLLCFAIALAFSAQAKLPNWTIHTTLIFAVFSSILFVILFLWSGNFSVRLKKSKTYFSKKIREGLINLLESFNDMSRLKAFLPIFALSMFIWIIESALYYFLLIGLGLKTNLALAIIVMAITSLSTFVPSSPGFVGPFHLAAFAAVSMLGGTPEQAASFALLCHLSLWVPTTLAGAIAILIEPELFRGLQKQMAQG